MDGSSAPRSFQELPAAGEETLRLQDEAIALDIWNGDMTEDEQLQMAINLSMETHAKDDDNIDTVATSRHHDTFNIPVVQPYDSPVEVSLAPASLVAGARTADHYRFNDSNGLRNSSGPYPWDGDTLPADDGNAASGQQVRLRWRGVCA